MNRDSVVVALVVALVGALIVIGLFTAVAFGADPSTLPTASSSPTALLASGDLRSDGAGPGLVGNPLLILVAVVALAIGTALVTLLIVRLATRGGSRTG